MGIIIDIVLNTPLTKDKVKALKVTDSVLISGIIYTARDAAHERLVADLKKGICPLDFKNQIIFYAGPSPTKPGEVTGSCGPTTSYRMDSFTPFLIEAGVTGMIGKGGRSETVIKSMVDNCAVYFAALGGAGALLAMHIKSSSVILYYELGAEAVYKLNVVNFPVTVAIDSYGNNIYRRNQNG